MTTDKTTTPDMPRTLAEAHEAVAAIRPSRRAPLSEWLAHHQRSAALYAEVAEIEEAAPQPTANRSANGHANGNGHAVEPGITPGSGRETTDSEL